MTNFTDGKELKINTDVLVVGGGFTGIKAASEISNLGYQVTLIENEANIGSQKEQKTLVGLTDEDHKCLQEMESRVTSDKRIEILTKTKVATIKGMPGDFSIRLSNNDNILEKKVGAVVVANDFSVNSLNDKYGLSLSDNILTQSQIEEILVSDKEKLADKTVAFLVGLAQETNPLIMERVMRTVIDINEIDGTATYIYTGNLKVASDGLERIYKEGRDKGATYFKLQEMPKISQDGKIISYHDPVLRRDIEVSPDMIVVDDEIYADKNNADLSEILRVDLGAGGFLQKDNVHRFPVYSNREGIFVVGPGRDVQKLQAAWMDVENAALEIKSFLGNGIKIVPDNKAVVDTGKCVFCLTCYRCCPHGAIYWAEENKAVISPLACQSCGICASECPMDAIQIGGFTDDEIKNSVKKSLDVKNEPKIVAFCCQNSAFEAGEMAKKFKIKLPDGLKMIKVPCAGKIDLDYILNTFVEGADGVLIMACHNGNCKSEKGNIYAGWRVDDAHRMLEETGLEKERLRFVTLASNMGSGFSSAVAEMENKIKEIGLSPLRN